MTRKNLPLEAVDYGRRLMTSAREPMIFHCNHYNYWLQKNLLINPDFGMDCTIKDAAAVQGFVTAKALAEKLLLEQPEQILVAAAEQYAQQGFGTLHFDDVQQSGARVEAPTSHYGQCLFATCGGDFAIAQNLFDQGYAAGAMAAAFNLKAGSYESILERCHSQGGNVGRFQLKEREVPADFFKACGEGYDANEHIKPPGPSRGTSIDEPGIHSALSGLDFSGNEEGLIPRFGVMLTDHYANFYNRISFHFLHTLKSLELMELGEELLVEAAHRCAFNTFGGIMISAEWQAVIEPMCKTAEDWVHGIVAVVNTFGWGTWRVHELSAERLVVRIYDDYESRGYLGMYGRADHPICFLANGGTAGIMNLVYTGHISEKPELDNDFYLKIFEASDRYVARQTQCMAMGHAYTEIVAERE